MLIKRVWSQRREHKPTFYVVLHWAMSPCVYMALVIVNSPGPSFCQHHARGLIKECDRVGLPVLPVITYSLLLFPSCMSDSCPLPGWAKPTGRGIDWQPTPSVKARQPSRRASPESDSVLSSQPKELFTTQKRDPRKEWDPHPLPIWGEGWALDGCTDDLSDVSDCDRDGLHDTWRHNTYANQTYSCCSVAPHRHPIALASFLFRSRMKWIYSSLQVFTFLW